MNIMRQNNYTTDNDNGMKFVLFLISPLLSLLYSIKSLEKRSSIIYVFLFCIFFGLAFTVSNIRVEGSPDGVSYRALFEDYSSVGYDEFMYHVEEYFSFDSKIKDLYADTVAFLVSRFTSNYHIFFLVIATVFAFFQLKTLFFLTRHRNYVFGGVCFLLVFLFTFVQIKNINGLRFWTSYWIALYALFSLLLTRRKKFLLLIASLPLFHGSFVVVWILMALYYITGKYEKIWFVLLIISSFVGNVSLALVRETVTYLPSFLAGFVDYYAAEEVVHKVGAKGSGFYMLDKIFPIMVGIYLFVMLLIINSKKNNIKDKQVKSLLELTIIIVSFSNFMMPVPSVGGRFIVMSYPFLAYLWLDIIGPNRYKKFIHFMPFVFIMTIYHMFQSYWENVDRLFYISSPIIDLFRFL